MRAFIGIAISDEVRAVLAGLQEQLARLPVKVKWTEPKNIHLTIKFLGEIEGPADEEVKRAMAAAAGDGPFEFTVAGAGSFPPRGNPRVIWAGVSDGSERVTEVQSRLEQALRPLGFESERSFVPHLTIGRVRSTSGSAKLAAALSRFAASRFGSCTATEMVLYESRLAPGGPVYTVVSRQAL